MADLFELADLGIVVAAGPDAGRFLQGQLSGDVLRLDIGAGQLTGLHNAQGRALALLRIWRVGASEYRALLPRELIESVLAILRARVFRAQVTLLDASDRWRVYGALQPPASGAAALSVDASGRCLLLADRALAAAGERDAWRALDIAAGLPQVVGATSGQFVAQMLNLDLLGGVAFDKGCYVGQEIIARSHYRGRIKRRMQRFAVPPGPLPQPGQHCALPDGTTALVVDACAQSQQMLAVAPIGAAGALPLPYSLPA
ncbi:MAG: hypothetical protein NZM12_02205 [Steroidobacteraceae bacterium]|nr:hypothetical protein [Steroidobacteraceae bacterium]MDW8259462.1 hypothetical protein [Gammaproteobacteria bacterium]